MGLISLRSQICILAQSCDVIPVFFAGAFPCEGLVESSRKITELHRRPNSVEGQLAG